MNQLIKLSSKIDKKIIQDSKVGFDFSKIMYRLMSIYYREFRVQYPRLLKNKILKCKVVFERSEQVIFEVLAADYIMEETKCPKCGKINYFTPTRYKKIEKMYRIKRPVLSEKKRTISCSMCSFTCHPLAMTGLANIKMDLRKFYFYKFMCDDGVVDFPIKAIAEILDVSTVTAKRLKILAVPSEDEDQKWRDKMAKKFEKFGEDHLLTKFLLEGEVKK